MEKFGVSASEVLKDSIRKEQRFSQIYATQARELRLARTETLGIGPDSLHFASTSRLRSITPAIGSKEHEMLMKSDLHNTHELMAITQQINASSRLPSEKYSVPRTEAQEYGWYSRTHGDVCRPFSRATHPRFEETKFVDNYVLTHHVGPFAKNQPIARNTVNSALRTSKIVDWKEIAELQEQRRKKR